MAHSGLCSRREADRFIEQGLVYVDGEKIDTLGTKVLDNQKVTLAKAAQNQQSQLLTVLINKPLGYVSGLPEDDYESAIMLLNEENRMNQYDKVPRREGFAPAGRLDIDSTGLLVFTQDGRIAKQLIGADNEIEKEYLITVSGTINRDVINQLKFGLSLDGKKLKPADVSKTQDKQLRFILKEGRKRQIRRMCELVDLKVHRLTRTRIGKIDLAGLAVGQWRYLKSNEKF